MMNSRATAAEYKDVRVYQLDQSTGSKPMEISNQQTKFNIKVGVQNNGTINYFFK